MFIHMLSSDVQVAFFEIAWLLSLSDNQLLWDGLTADEVTGEADLEKVEFQIDPTEKEILGGFAREAGLLADESLLGELKELPNHYLQKTSYGSGIFRSFSGVSEETAIAGYIERGKLQFTVPEQIGKRLTEKLRTLPLMKQNQPEQRLNVAKEVLAELLIKNFGTGNGADATAKIMLYELFLLCLADGKLTDTENALLNQVAHFLHIDDSVFAVLNDEASAMSQKLEEIGELLSLDEFSPSSA